MGQFINEKKFNEFMNMKKEYFELCKFYKKKYGEVKYSYHRHKKFTYHKDEGLTIHHIYYGALKNDLSKNESRNNKKYLCYVSVEEHKALHKQFDKYFIW